MMSSDSLFASLAGSAIGDALGLPYENLSARRAARLLGEPDRFRLAFGARGMVSDDAEHACMTIAAFATAGGDVDRFRRDLARRLRWWLLTIPPGVGLATLRSILKLWLGVAPTRSGVWSAGNGPAMRAAILGRLCDDDRLFAFVAASTRITHRDPKATLGAYAVALASRAFADRWPNDEVHLHAGPERTRARPDLAAQEPGRREYALPRRVGATLVLREVIDAVARGVPNDHDTTELLALLGCVEKSIERGEPTEAFADSFCRRRGFVSGYVYETVPIAMHAAFSHPDAMAAMRAAIRCGGDTDSVASIVGGIVGVRDAAMLDRLIEWPCDAARLRRLCDAGATGATPPRLPFFSRVVRNAIELAFVLLHVVRRALPKY